MATDKNKHLDCVLSSHKISKEESFLQKHIDKRKEIKEALEEKFGTDMYAPFNSGSYAKNTAVNTKFDFDLMVPFKRNSYDTLEKMYIAVYDFLYEKYKSLATVRKQKVSIGLEFLVEGEIVKVDVVPGRELNQDEYDKDKRLNLYVYEQFGKIEKGSDHLLTNVHAQIENIRDRATAEKDSIRKIIRLLKIWKIGRGAGPKSFFIELITIKAFDAKTITGDLWEKLKIVLEYIKDNAKTVSLPDPGNSGNEVADTLSDLEKSTLSDDVKNMIDRITENEDHISSFFRINSKHPCEEKSENTYGVKKEGVSKPPATRFG
ncbi:MAG: nucleotidyltransferase [Bacteroidia bacterium]|nr:nucleotidyltransferase [Bacteroidia bacterium]